MFISIPYQGKFNIQKMGGNWQIIGNKKKYLFKKTSPNKIGMLVTGINISY